MIEQITVKNVALIKSAEINFNNGLNVLSGETGSGKSVILEALNFVLGAKADKSLIKSGENECYVSAVFNVKDIEQIKLLCEEEDIDYDDCLIISRKYSLEGKNTIKINGFSTNVSILKKFTSLLIDVHGQSEHFNLLKQSNQLELLDKFGSEEILPVKTELKSIFTEYKSVLSELNKLGGDENARLNRLDILDYQIKEITEADLKENEEEFLLNKKTSLLNQEKIITSLRGVYESVKNEGGVDDILYNADKMLSAVSGINEEYESLYSRLSSAFSELDDIADTCNSIIESFDSDDVSLDYVEERLSLIKKLKRKYGENYGEIISYLNNAEKEKENLINFNVVAEKLLKQKSLFEKELYDKYKKLSVLRKKYSDYLSKHIIKELNELAITKANFVVNFNDFPSFEDCKFNSSNGINEVEFMFSANLGEPLKPLSFVISGGEMSRFMLAIKTVTSSFNDIPTLVFDEIDAGISGKVAGVVAQKFADISKRTQIIAVSHLPQISCMADTNLLIEKSETEDNTYTSVKQLSEEDKILEIVRLVGGKSGSESAIAHAKEMILDAINYKKSI